MGFEKRINQMEVKMPGMKGKSGGRRVGAGRKSKKLVFEPTEKQREIINEYKRFMGEKYDDTLFSHVVVLLAKELEEYKNRCQGFDTLLDFLNAKRGERGLDPLDLGSDK